MNLFSRGFEGVKSKGTCFSSHIIIQAGLVFWRESAKPWTPLDTVKPATKIQLKHLVLAFSILCIGLLAALIVFAWELCKYRSRWNEGDLAVPSKTLPNIFKC